MDEEEKGEMDEEEKCQQEGKMDEERGRTRIITPTTYIDFLFPYYYNVWFSKGLVLVKLARLWVQFPHAGITD